MNKITDEFKKEKEKLQSVTNRHKKIISLISVVVIVVVWIFIAYFFSKPVLRYVADPEKFRDWVSGYGIFGYFICIGISGLQVIMPGVPSTPVAIGAGYAFGPIAGTLLYMIGFTIGCAIVFNIVKKFGQPIVENFFPLEKIKSLKFLHNKRKRRALTFFLFLLPGSPKSLIAYFMGLTDIKLNEWLWLAALGRMPSIIIYAVGGDAVNNESYITAVMVLGMLVVATLIGALIYRYIIIKKHKK